MRILLDEDIPRRLGALIFGHEVTTIVMPSVEEDRALVAAAKSDPDALPLTPMQLKSMVPLASLRGRPKSANPKQLVSVLWR
jgi:hypothetical protein